MLRAASRQHSNSVPPILSYRFTSFDKKKYAINSTSLPYSYIQNYLVSNTIYQFDETYGTMISDRLLQPQPNNHYRRSWKILLLHLFWIYFSSLNQSTIIYSSTNISLWARLYPDRSIFSFSQYLLNIPSNGKNWRSRKKIFSLHLSPAAFLAQIVDLYQTKLLLFIIVRILTLPRIIMCNSYSM